jgi:dynein heavy chain
MNEKIVMATLNVYRRIQEDLKPTPAKSHYTFNLRDVSKVICGICLMNAKELKNPDTAVRLWAHESTRVFGDRLINEDDRKWMLDSVTDCVRAPFGSDFNTLFRHLDSNHDGKVDSIDEFRGCLFGDIYTPFQMRERDYVEVLDKDKLKVCANGALEQYNGNADKPMNLVLFNFAVEHLLRIGRIIKQPNGHALLVGVGGSGRQSLTRLASAIPDYDVF